MHEKDMISNRVIAWDRVQYEIYLYCTRNMR